MAKKKKKKVSKKRQRTIIQTIFWAFVAVACLIWFVNNMTNTNAEIKTKEEEYAALQEELSEKKKELNKKNMEANYYQSDENIERVAKEELGLVNPQEVVFIQSN